MSRPPKAAFLLPAEWLAQMVYKALIAKANHVGIDRTDRLASKAEKSTPLKRSRCLLNEPGLGEAEATSQEMEP
jgi:hypothetical protein